MTEKTTTFTIGEIADRLGEPPSRVSYIISKHRIKAADRAGILRLFTDEQIELVRQGLYGIRIKRGKNE